MVYSLIWLKLVLIRGVNNDHAVTTVSRQTLSPNRNVLNFSYRRRKNSSSMSSNYFVSVSGWPHINATLEMDSNRDMHDHWRLLSAVVTERSNILRVTGVRNPNSTQHLITHDLIRNLQQCCNERCSFDTKISTYFNTWKSLSLSFFWVN